MDRRRIAVVGSGVAGLTAAHVMRNACDVTLYEADDRLGGHAHTREVAEPDGRPLRVDMGFIVHNERTYPHLLRLFRELGVQTQESEMSMSVRCDGCGLEYAGARGARGLFPRAGHALRGAYLKLLAEVPRFHRAARALLAAEPDGVPGGEDSALTLGEFLERGGFSGYFVSHFMTPLVSAVWSCAPQTAMRYPARYLFRFLDHHGMLTVTGSPTWRTVTGGSAEYVDRLAKQLPDVRTGTPVTAVRRDAAGAEVDTAAGGTTRYDAVVLALHPDQALTVLTDPTPAESRVLGAFSYSHNPTLLHTDTTELPASSGAAASWNYLMPSCDAPSAAVRVSYDMNRLMRLDATERYVVSLNATGHVDPAKVLAATDFRHPLYTPGSVAAQRLLPTLNTGVTAYAGAYHGWGFHEDGCRSGVLAAAALGVTW